MVTRKISNQTFVHSEDVHELLKNDTNTILFKNVTFKNYIPDVLYCNKCAFIDCVFENCDLSYSSFVDIYINRITFKNCNLDNIIIDNAWYNKKCKIIFENCTLYDASLPEIPIDTYIFKNSEHAPKIVTLDDPIYGYKYTKNHLIVLELSKGTTYLQTTSEICRTDKVKVISILNIDGTYSGDTRSESWYDNSFVYSKDNILTEKCNFLKYDTGSNGIHFYKNIKDAYAFYYTSIRWQYML